MASTDNEGVDSKVADSFTAGDVKDSQVLKRMHIDDSFVAQQPASTDLKRVQQRTACYDDLHAFIVEPDRGRQIQMCEFRLNSEETDDTGIFKRNTFTVGHGEVSETKAFDVTQQVPREVIYTGSIGKVYAFHQMSIPTDKFHHPIEHGDPFGEVEVDEAVGNVDGLQIWCHRDKPLKVKLVEVVTAGEREMFETEQEEWKHRFLGIVFDSPVFEQFVALHQFEPAQVQQIPHD